MAEAKNNIVIKYIHYSDRVQVEVLNEVLGAKVMALAIQTAVSCEETGIKGSGISRYMIDPASQCADDLWNGLEALVSDEAERVANAESVIYPYKAISRDEVKLEVVFFEKDTAIVTGPCPAGDVCEWKEADFEPVEETGQYPCIKENGINAMQVVFFAESKGVVVALGGSSYNMHAYYDNWDESSFTKIS